MRRRTRRRCDLVIEEGCGYLLNVSTLSVDNYRPIEEVGLYRICTLKLLGSV